MPHCVVYTSLFPRCSFFRLLVEALLSTASRTDRSTYYGINTSVRRKKVVTCRDKLISFAISYTVSIFTAVVSQKTNVSLVWCHHLRKVNHLHDVPVRTLWTIFRQFSGFYDIRKYPHLFNYIKGRRWPVYFKNQKSLHIIFNSSKKLILNAIISDVSTIITWSSGTDSDADLSVELLIDSRCHGKWQYNILLVNCG